MYTDTQLEQAFMMKNGSKVYRATFDGDWSAPKLFAANSKKEATIIAREYGVRFIHKKLRWVYLVPKYEWK